MNSKTICSLCNWKLPGTTRLINSEAGVILFEPSSDEPTNVCEWNLLFAPSNIHTQTPPRPPWCAVCARALLFDLSCLCAHREKAHWSCWKKVIDRLLHGFYLEIHYQSHQHLFLAPLSTVACIINYLVLWFYGSLRAFGARRWHLARAPWVIVVARPLAPLYYQEL